MLDGCRTADSRAHPSEGANKLVPAVPVEQGSGPAPALCSGSVSQRATARFTLLLCQLGHFAMPVYLRVFASIKHINAFRSA